MTPMIRACYGSQVCVERLDVRRLSFSRRRRFKKTYHCNSRTQLRCVIHPAETDFTSRFQSRSLTSSFLKVPPPHPLLRDFCCALFFYLFFLLEFPHATGFFAGGLLSQKQSDTQERVREPSQPALQASVCPPSSPHRVHLVATFFTLWNPRPKCHPSPFLSGSLRV